MGKEDSIISLNIPVEFQTKKPTKKEYEIKEDINIFKTRSNSI